MNCVLEHRNHCVEMLFSSHHKQINIDRCTKEPPKSNIDGVVLDRSSNYHSLQGGACLCRFSLWHPAYRTVCVQHVNRFVRMKSRCIYTLKKTYRRNAPSDADRTLRSPWSSCIFIMSRKYHESIHALFQKWNSNYSVCMGCQYGCEYYSRI